MLDNEENLTAWALFGPASVLLVLEAAFPRWAPRRPISVVVIFGLPPIGVLIFGLLVSVNDVFQHGHIALPRMIDRWLRQVLVTPDMNRILQSIIQTETDSNYGVVFPWWDRVLGTYREEPERGHSGMTMGLKEFDQPRHINVLWILALPFLPWPVRCSLR